MQVQSLLLDTALQQEGKHTKKEFVQLREEQGRDAHTWRGRARASPSEEKGSKEAVKSFIQDSSLLAAKSLQSCPTVQPHRRQPTRLPRPWDSPGKNTGVGCHFLLQCMKVESKSEVAQLCPTLSDPMDCSLPVSSIHGIFQARVLEWVSRLLIRERECLKSQRMAPGPSHTTCILR